ncbi:hypothetical protein D3H65_05600 [Paraflavitalea soli]|uniref:Uncharacterized protein n=1 Tax=Paraflavitalea soli TaxID=2315862 RepID=A0A3B7MGI8_9BACT|nr:hypothetical protein D3H65_05600 [Paraflavitalea soli]
MPVITYQAAFRREPDKPLLIAYDAFDTILGQTVLVCKMLLVVKWRKTWLGGQLPRAIDYCEEKDKPDSRIQVEPENRKHAQRWIKTSSYV